MASIEIADDTEVILVEPFYGGSHRQLMDLLNTLPKTKLYTMTAKKWPWRSRTAALHFSEAIPDVADSKVKTIFASSVLNLAELVAIRPDLLNLRKILYFHENQLIYPVQTYKDRDFQHGYNQILSCLVADVVVFNSEFNKTTFLNSINTFLNAMPDYKPRHLAEKIRTKCKVMHFPIKFDERNVDGRIDSFDSFERRHGPKSVGNSGNLDFGKDSQRISDERQEIDKDLVPYIPCKDTNDMESSRQKSAVNDVITSGVKRRKLHIVWPHRWEHDKNADSFFSVLLRLKEADCDFSVSVLGERFSDVPGIFEESRLKLSDHISNWGYQENRQDYISVLEQADVVVSTANHEFYGVAMLEAVYHGCIPLCPNRLVYPEFYPEQFIYNTDNQLYKILREFCTHPQILQKYRELLKEFDIERFSWTKLETEFRTLLGI